MHPRHYVEGTKGKFFDWLADYHDKHTSKSRKFVKKQANKFLRRDSRKVIQNEMKEAA